MILNTYAETQLMCAFCENLVEETQKVCGFCADYKGIMTIARFEKLFGKEY